MQTRFFMVTLGIMNNFCLLIAYLRLLSYYLICDYYLICNYYYYWHIKRHLLINLIISHLEEIEMPFEIFMRRVPAVPSFFVLLHNTNLEL